MWNLSEQKFDISHRTHAFLLIFQTLHIFQILHKSAFRLFQQLGIREANASKRKKNKNKNKK